MGRVAPYLDPTSQEEAVDGPSALCCLALVFVLSVACLALNLVPLSGKITRLEASASPRRWPPQPAVPGTPSAYVGPAGPQASRLCQSYPRTICNVETPVSLYLWAKLSWFWAINPNGALAMWALVLEDQKCPATSLNYVIILPPPFPPG